MVGLARIIIVAIVLAPLASWSNIASAFLAPVGVPGLARKPWETAEAVCAGKVLKSRPLRSVAPWWLGYMRGAGIRAYEAEFKVDRVVRGPADLAGGVIRIRYPVIEQNTVRGGKPAPVWGFSEHMGEKRCLVLLEKHAGDAYYLGLGSAYMPLAPRPEVEGWGALKPEERLDIELAATILSPEERRAQAAMESAARLALCGKRTMQALLRRRSDPDLRLRGGAIEALIRLRHMDTIVRLRDEIAAWPENERARSGLAKISCAVQIVKDKRLVPILAELSLCDAPAVRQAAVRALRRSKSADAVPALAPFLDDKSYRLQYHALMGLAAATDRLNPEWAWGYAHFQEDPDTLVNKWKTWWQEEGRGRYPSLEDVLKKAEAVRREHAEKPAAPPAEAPSGHPR